MDLFQSLFGTKDALKEITIDSKVRMLAFVPGEKPRVVTVEDSSVQLRGLENLRGGKPIENTGALALVSSSDGRWIVTGATDGFAIWNVVQGGVVREVVRHHTGAVRTVDISSDCKWAITGSDDRTANVWDISTGERRPGLGPLRHDYNVIVVKFCPCGERIATATLFGSVRIFATSSGQKLYTIPITVNVNMSLSIPSSPFAWFMHRPQFFAISQGQVKCLNSEDGSIVFQWALRGITHPSSVALSPNNKLIAYTLNDTVILGDPASEKQIGNPLQHEGDVSCLAFSPGGDVLMTGAETKLTMWNLRKLGVDASYFVEASAFIRAHFLDLTREHQNTTKPALSCAPHKEIATKKPPPTTYSLPLMSIINAAVKGWLHGFLDHVEKVLSEEIERSATAPDHNLFANRALIRGRLKNGKTALEDAEKSLRIRESAIGWIAKAIAFIHLEDYESAKQAIPRVLQARNSDESTFFLEVIQSILRCLSGGYEEEKTRIDELSGDRKLVLFVQANMHLFKERFDDAAGSCSKAFMPAIFPHEETREMWTLLFILGWKFSGLAIQIQQRKCQSLLDAEDSKAADLFVEVKKTYAREIATHVELSDWSSEFRKTCLEKLEARGDRALSEEDYAEAIKQYTAIEPLIGIPEMKFYMLLKRSEAHAKIVPSNWMKALQDAEEAIRIDPYSPWGHDRKHEVLYAQRHFAEAATALNEMIVCLADSRDKKSKALREQGVSARETRKIVLDVVDETLALPRPLILINTESWRLCDKDKQKEAFRAYPRYKKFILSPTAEVKSDGPWKEEIRQYFHYSTFSHTWEDKGEPLFRDLEYIGVDRLTDSFPNKKLQTFCKISSDHKFLWAWSDTVCIKKEDREVLSLSLRSMYRWYTESSLTIVHLKGVLDALEVDLDTLLVMLDEELDKLLQGFVDCRWNKRAWTLQEYFASKVIHFYTEDWKPFLPLPDVNHPDSGLINHKDLRPIQRAMERVTGLSAARLATLKPGSADARQKLSLASMRAATRREDVAYSLLGIFKVTIEAIYGDDEIPRALGRLLEALLTQSADVSILAWTGKPSEYNTCLPDELAVYQVPDSQYIPDPNEETELRDKLEGMRSSMSEADLKAAITLHDQLLDAPPPELHHGRLKLTCILFSVSSIHQDTSANSYTAIVPLLGTVEIKTEDDLPGARNMYLVHPWFKTLLDPGISLSESVRRDNALKLLASLRRPFGALLLAWTTRDYNRIATDALITVQVPENVSPAQLSENVRLLYIR